MLRCVLFLACLFVTSLAGAVRDERIKVSIEEPANGASYSGISNLRGWAVSPEGVGEYLLEVFIDGEFAFYLSPYGQRTDVGNAFPDYPNSDTGGFSMAYNYKDLAPGEHEVKVVVYDNAGNHNSAISVFRTERFNSSFIAQDAEIDLSTTDSIYLYDDQTYLVSGATLEGEKWDFILTWDRASQSFKTEGIAPSTGNAYAYEKGSTSAGSGAEGSGAEGSGSPSDLLTGSAADVLEPKYALLFSVGAGGKIIDAESEFECESKCEIKPDDVLQATYEAVPDEHYQFAGWSGEICNTPNTYDNPRCNVSVNRDQLGLEQQLHIKAEFARIAYIDSVESTEEFEVSSYGFGAFYSDEISPVTCYPTLDNCSEGDQAVWHQPHNYASGDFNADGFQDLLIMPFSNSGYVRDLEVRPTIFLNDKEGGLYRADSIFDDALAAGMQMGYRVAVDDFNGDDRDDFVVGAMGTLSREPHNYMDFVPERYLIYLSGEDGKLYDASNLIEGQENGAVMPDMKFAHDLATGDIDGDGDMDIWMGEKLFENNGLGAFAIQTTSRDIDGLPDWAMSSLIADFDGDGIGDLVHAEADPNAKVWLYLSRGEPNLSRRQRSLMPVGRFGVENTKHNYMDASDLDGDGDLDIVIGQTRAQPYYEGRELQVLINDGYGKFTDETNARLGDQSSYSTGDAFNQGEGAVHLLDVNADGFIDIFDRRGDAYHPETAPPSAGASIWLNDGAGHFVDVPPTVFPVVEPRDLAPQLYKNFTSRLKDSTPIDIDNDGAIDLVSYVVTNSYPSNSFSESTLYLLTAKKLLDSSDYDD